MTEYLRPAPCRCCALRVPCDGLLRACTDAERRSESGFPILFSSSPRRKNRVIPSSSLPPPFSFVCRLPPVFFIFFRVFWGAPLRFFCVPPGGGKGGDKPPTGGATAES